MTPHKKIQVHRSIPLAPPTGQSFSYISACNFCTVCTIFKILVSLQSLGRATSNASYDVLSTGIEFQPFWILWKSIKMLLLPQSLTNVSVNWYIASLDWASQKLLSAFGISFIVWPWQPIKIVLKGAKQEVSWYLGSPLTDSNYTWHRWSAPPPKNAHQNWWDLAHRGRYNWQNCLAPFCCLQLY